MRATTWFRRLAVVAVLVAAVASNAPGARAAATYAVTPCRLIDTREGTASPHGPLANGTRRSFALQGKCGVPVGAHGAFINVTVVNPTLDGNVRVFPTLSAPPSTSTVNFTGGIDAIANGTLVALSNPDPQTGHDLDVLVGLAGTGELHLILDVTGYVK